MRLELGQFYNKKFLGFGNLFHVFSQKLTSTQKRYSTFGRELYANYAAVRHFKHFLEGRRFYVFTDHKPFVGAFRSNSEKYSPREMRNLDYLLQFTSDIRHLKGAENIPADAMSRTINVIFFDPCTNMTEFGKEQLKDQILQNLLQDNWTFLKLTKIHVPNSNLDSTGKICPFVPESFQRVFFSSLHNLFHPGVNASIKLMTDMCGLGYLTVGKNLWTGSKGKSWKTHADTCWSFPISRWTIRTRTYRHHWSFTSLWGVYLLVDMRSFFSLVQSPSHG